ncbi:MAG TPA: mechanosensitive ion channel family protein [Actinomycetota bacterium]|jgi:small conductance mechanosensitive channel|nr:mechanosensitive ion channel family protein [Actinomycetota bacterium]
MKAMLAETLRATRFDAGKWFDDHGIPVITAVVVAIALSIVLKLVVRRFRRRLEGSTLTTQELNLQRIATLTGALSTAGVVVIWTVAVLIVLGNLNVSLGPLLASAGVAGVALGFGAQSVVRDTLSGFFILLENQFGVGDVIELHTTAGNVTGKVESLTLRVTTLRAFDGALHLVPNGNIQLVSNKSRGWARAIVDVRVAYGEDVERIRGVLDAMFEEVRSDPELSDWVREGPSVLGIETLADYALVIRVIADTRPSKRWNTERALRERIARRLDAEGIRVPIPPTVMPKPGEPAR